MAFHKDWAVIKKNITVSFQVLLKCAVNCIYVRLTLYYWAVGLERLSRERKCVRQRDRETERETERTRERQTGRHIARQTEGGECRHKSGDSFSYRLIRYILYTNKAMK